MGGYTVDGGGKRSFNKGEILRIADILANPAAMRNIIL
jgi:hypothetical protein